MSFSPCPLSLGSLSLSSRYSHFLPSASYLFSPLHLLPLLFLSTYTRSIYLSLPLPPRSFPSVPSLSSLLHLLPLLFLSTYTHSIYLHPSPFRPQPILSSPPSTLPLSIYICLYPYPLSHQPRSFPPVPSLSSLLHLLPLLFLSIPTPSSP